MWWLILVIPAALLGAVLIRTLRFTPKGETPLQEEPVTVDRERAVAAL